MANDISVELDAGVLTLTLERPEKKNAIDNAMYATLADAVERGETDPAVRVLLIRSTGDLFTSGNDLSDFAAISAGGPVEEHHGSRFIHGLATATTPIVAAAQGKAVGIGTTMLLHCDYVLLAEGASLTTPFVDLALVPEAASSLLLPGSIGHQRAFGMFALGESLPATDALALGIANAIVASEDLHAEAGRVAARLAAKPVGALRATKKLMRDAARLAEHTELEMQVFRDRLRSAEAAEAFSAFAEKRRPDFTRFR